MHSGPYANDTNQHAIKSIGGFQAEKNSDGLTAMPLAGSYETPHESDWEIVLKEGGSPAKLVFCWVFCWMVLGYFLCGFGRFPGPLGDERSLWRYVGPS